MSRGAWVDAIEARAFWRGVCAARAECCDISARNARHDARIYADLPVTLAAYESDAEAQTKRAAWLRACMEAP